MRLVRFGHPGTEIPGLLVEKEIIDLRAVFPDIPDIGEAFFKEGWLDKLVDIDPDSRKETRPLDAVRLGPPLFRPAKIICLGRNFAAHAQEGGVEAPTSPLLFCKSQNTVNGPYDPIQVPTSFGQIDWEVELAVVIKRTAKRVPRKDAFHYIAGYMVLNDVTSREAQNFFSQWYRGKTLDTFAPMGPWLTTADEIDDPHNLNLITRVNGETMQNGNTRQMIFDIPALIENISEDITLIPGDIISTGTPEGVGVYREPPIFLKAGDTVECEIESLGALKNVCVEST